jgi:hypothetical protein
VAPRWRRFLRSGGTAVRIECRRRADDAAADRRTTAPRRAGGRPEPARLDGSACAHCGRRCQRPGANEGGRAAVEPDRRLIRVRRRAPLRTVFLAQSPERRGAGVARASPLRTRATGARLRRAAAGR